MKGSILFLVGPENSGTHQGLRPIISALPERGWRVETRFVPNPAHFDEVSGSWDIVHCGYLGLHDFPTDALKTLSLWSPNGQDDRGTSWLFDSQLLRKFDRIFVVDSTTALALAHASIYPVFAPFVWSAHDFRPLPAPPGEFTVGTFGNDYRPGTQNGKRFHVVQAACERAGLRYEPAVSPASRVIYDLNPLDIYSRVHVLAHAGLADTLALPPLEALNCGRPVVSTRIPALQGYLLDSINGRYFDGSIEDLAEKLLDVRDSYVRYHAGAIFHTPQPPLYEAVRAFDAAFCKLLDLEEVGVPIVRPTLLSDAERGTNR